MFARMNALGDFVRVHAYSALRPRGFRKLGRHLTLDLPAQAPALGRAFREAVGTEVLPRAQRMAGRERLLAEFDDPASPVLRLGPTTRQVLLRLGRAGAAEIESLLAQLADHPSRSRFAAWTRSYLSTAAK